MKIPNSELLRRVAAILIAVTDLLSNPLARWDGLHLVLDLVRVERHINEYLMGNDRLDDLCLRGAGDAVAAEVTVSWKGFPFRVRMEIAEIRLRHRHLGFRMRRVRGLGGVPVPRAAIELGLGSLRSDVLTVFSGQGIVVLDLRQRLPPELDLRVLTVQGTARSLHLWFGPGGLSDLPRRGPRQLPAGSPAD